MDSSEEACGQVDITYYGTAPLHFGSQGASCVIRKVSLTSRMRNMWSLFHLAQLLFRSCYHLYLGVSLSTVDSLAPQPGAHLSPASDPLERHPTFSLHSFWHSLIAPEKEFRFNNKSLAHPMLALGLCLLLGRGKT